MASIITYDVPSRHVEVKREMTTLGYRDQIPDPTCRIIYLPNTTLYHPTKTPAEARNDLQAVCVKLQVHLERCIATNWTGWAAICGEPFN